MSDKDENPAPGVFHVISGEAILEMLDRVSTGEDPEWVYMEMFVNGERLDPDSD